LVLVEVKDVQYDTGLPPSGIKVVIPFERWDKISGCSMKCKMRGCDLRLCPWSSGPTKKYFNQARNKAALTSALHQEKYLAM